MSGSSYLPVCLRLRLTGSDGRDEGDSDRRPFSHLRPRSTMGSLFAHAQHPTKKREEEGTRRSTRTLHGTTNVAVSRVPINMQIGNTYPKCIEAC